MDDFLDEITDIESDDPIEIVIELEKKLRPPFEYVSNGIEAEMAFRYASAVKRACELFGCEFQVEIPEQESTNEARRLLYLTRLEIDKKKIELLHAKKKRTSGLALDQHWRAKIHTYLAHVRLIVERADISVQIRDSIFTKLHDLDEEVDRVRTRVQKFNDTLVGLCEGISEGASALKPAVAIFERIVGALARLQTGGEPVLALPPPEAFGLPDEGLPEFGDENSEPR